MGTTLCILSVLTSPQHRVPSDCSLLAGGRPSTTVGAPESACGTPLTDVGAPLVATRIVGICGAPDDANGNGFIVIACVVVGFVDIRTPGPVGAVTCCCAIKNAHICCCCSKVSYGIPDSAGGAPTVSCGALAAIIGAPVTGAPPISVCDNNMSIPVG